MPVFSWRRRDLASLMLVSTAVHGAGAEARARIEREIFHAGMQPDLEAEAELARTRWLEEHRAERTFPCGVVPDPVLEATDPGRTQPPPPRPDRPLLPSEPGWAAPDPAVMPPVTATAPPEPQPLTPLRAMQVLAAVLPDDLVFIREYGRTEEVEEVGRLPRTSIQDVDVVDPQGTHVPEPFREDFEPSQLVFMLLRWTNQDTPDEDRFLFRSPWVAWEAARRLLAAKR